MSLNELILAGIMLTADERRELVMLKRACNAQGFIRLPNLFGLNHLASLKKGLLIEKCDERVYALTNLGRKMAQELEG